MMLVLISFKNLKLKILFFDLNEGIMLILKQILLLILNYTYA